MKILLVSLCMALMNTPSPSACRTTVTVVNCQGEAVAGAKVTVVACHNKKEYTLKTGSDGKASFEICEKDVCNISVIARVDTKQVSGVRDNCTGQKEDYHCTFKLCDEQ